MYLIALCAHVVPPHVAGSGHTAVVANSAFYGQEHPPSPATKGRLWAERVKTGETSVLCRTSAFKSEAAHRPGSSKTCSWLSIRGLLCQFEVEHCCSAVYTKGRAGSCLWQPIRRGCIVGIGTRDTAASSFVFYLRNLK